MSSAQCLPVKRWREVVMRRCWWWGDGGDDSGGIATGTQKRGSKQGEALTSACFTFERQRGRREEEERERERGTDWRSRKKQDRRKKRDKQWREEGGGRRAQGEAMCQVPRRESSGRCSLAARPHGGGRGQEVTLTKLRVAVRRLRRGVTTVPLRLRPIRLRFSPSSGSTP